MRKTGRRENRNQVAMAEKYCRKHELNVKLKYGMATEIPFPERSFDYVIVMSISTFSQEIIQTDSNSFKNIMPISLCGVSTLTALDIHSLNSLTCYPKCL